MSEMLVFFGEQISSLDSKVQEVVEVLQSSMAEKMQTPVQPTKKRKTTVEH
jgi:hypothetical protein